MRAYLESLVRQVGSITCFVYCSIVVGIYAHWQGDTGSVIGMPHATRSQSDIGGGVYQCEVHGVHTSMAQWMAVLAGTKGMSALSAQGANDHRCSTLLPRDTTLQYSRLLCDVHHSPGAHELPWAWGYICASKRLLGIWRATCCLGPAAQRHSYMISPACGIRVVPYLHHCSNS